MDKTKKTFVVISGASRGIGRQCAVALADKLSGTGSELLLLGRDEAMLEETKGMVAEREGLTARVAAVDNVEAEKAEQRFKELMLEAKDKCFEAAIVVSSC